MKQYIRSNARRMTAVLIGAAIAAMPLTFAYADTSATIQSLSSGGTVTAGTALTFTIVPSGFTNPTYSLTDSMSGSSLTSASIDSNGNFNWTPTTQDIGTHTVTANISDSLGHTYSTSQTITVTATPTVSVQALMPGTSVGIGSPLTFTVSPNGFTNPTYTLSDTFGSGTTVSNSNLNSNGTFTWTPTSSDLGTHTFNITAIDAYGHLATISQQVSVQQGNLTVNYVNPSNSVTVGTPITVTVAASGLNNPTYSLTDSFSGTSLNNSNINSSGMITWTPTSADVGTHTITIHGSDTAGNSGNVMQTITVNNGGTTSASAAIAALPASVLAGLTPSDEQTMLIIMSVVGSDQATIDAFKTAYANAQASNTSSYTFTTNLGVGSTGDAVTQLQTKLTNLGYYSGPITGYYGSLTAAGVVSYQAAKGIAQVGVVGPQTRAALNSQ